MQANMPKVGRNDLCPCGSGKKFKYCHEGREAELVAVLANGGQPAPSMASQLATKQGAAKAAQPAKSQATRGRAAPSAKKR
jgi:preprotein translocase subunit SecA